LVFSFATTTCGDIKSWAFKFFDHHNRSLWSVSFIMI
jgi:hypothetical protein